MSGSIFIFTKTPDELLELEFDLDNLDRLRHIALERLITLDFETAMQGTGMKWALGNPVAYDADAGIAIFKVNPQALQEVFACKTKLEAISVEDANSFRQFLHENGFENIYELATF